jgi:hypothetical protein
LLGADPAVAGYGGAYYGSDHVDGRQIPELGMDPVSAVTPPIRSGRMIQRADEVVLGTATIAELGKHIGDTVTTSSGPLHIVGTATFPTIGVVHGDHTSLGVGAIVVPERVPGAYRNAGVPADGSEPLPDSYGPNVLFVRFRPGADQAAAVKRIEQMQDIGDSDGIAVTRVQRSAEIVNAGDIRGSSAFLGVAVAIAAMASLALAMTTVVRQRRRDLALLKAVGFTRGQVSRAVAWQATATIALGLVVGIPVGVAAGRMLWDRFADRLDVLARPSVPVDLLAIGVVAAILLANALALIPARAARRVPAAVLLRSE